MLPADRRRWNQPRQRNVFLIASIFLFSSCAVALACSLLQSSAGFLCGRPSPTRRQGRIAAAAQGVKVTKLKKGQKYDQKSSYRGPVDAKLRSLLGAGEYREMTQLLGRLEAQGLLRRFLDRAEEYWGDLDLLQIAQLEQKGGGKMVIQKVRKDWPRIWPEDLEEERLDAFEVVSRFLLRLDRSKVIDLVMNEVLPDIDRGGSSAKKSADSERLQEMTSEERRVEFMQRLGDAKIVQQYIGLSKDDKDVATIGGKMMPFLVKCISLLEYKVSAGMEEMGEKADQATNTLVAVSVLALVIASQTQEVPSLDSILNPLPPVERSQPAPDPVPEVDPSKIPKYVPRPAGQAIMNLAD